MAEEISPEAQDDRIMEGSQVEEEVGDVDVDFVPPSVHQDALFAGRSFNHFSLVPDTIRNQVCVMGIDEAGRGPVLGPMVYGCFYLPVDLEESLLKKAHGFTDSKQLTAGRRAYLMRRICSLNSDLYDSCGWATCSISAQDISSGMLRGASYNLNSQALDATVALIRGVIQERGVRVKEVFVDTLGAPEAHRRRLQNAFPGVRFTVEKKADALFPVVGAASVAAKVTRDAALEVCAERLPGGKEVQNWGSGYPSDSRCTAWLKSNMDPVFGWGPECRFSWSTSKELLEVKKGANVDWPVDQDGDMKMTQFLVSKEEPIDELAGWYGRRAPATAF